MAGEGKNLVAKNLLDLEPTAILEFFILQPDPSTAPEGQVSQIPFHGGTIFNGNVTWQGTKYVALAVETEGFEQLGDRRLPRPTIRISNNNQLVTYLLQNNNDLINAKLIRKKAFVKNLDDVNFDGGNPWNQANSAAEIINEVWIIGRKRHESKMMVEFELNSPMDLESFDVNYRSVVSKYCYWQYRGEGCRYAGVPVEKEDGTPFLDPTGGTIVPNLIDASNSPEISKNFFNNPNYEWQPQRQYVTGEVVYVKNDNVLIQGYNHNQPYPVDSQSISNFEAMKTVYVCVSGNNGQKPEINPTYWQKDGCTKQLNACRKRFSDKVSYYLSSKFKDEIFNTTEYFGNKIITNDTDQSAALFYSAGSGWTGCLTGEFTLAGWAKANDASSNLSAIWSTTEHGFEQEDVGVQGSVWPSGSTAKFINLARERSYLIDNVLTAPSIGINNINLYYTEDRYDGSTRNPIDDSDPINNVATQVSPVASVSDRWNFYVIMLDSPNTELVEQDEGIDSENVGQRIRCYVNPVATLDDEHENFPLDLLSSQEGDDGILFQRFANLTSRKSPYGNFAGLPEHFMLGAIPSGGVHPTMNGELGPWMLWNRVLQPDEVRYLYKGTPNLTKLTPENYLPRPYSECTGRFGTLTGSGAAAEGTLFAKDSLVAWWDMTTGVVPIDGIAADTTGLADIHTGGNWLSGSGLVSGAVETETYYETRSLQNFSSPYPRFGGYPGTDGFGWQA
tara:strand:+ start:312 stop:2504 length:2193 start_codon:yes stop_codon:yes gene_type:complete